MRTLSVLLLAAFATLFAVPANAAPVTRRLAVVVIQNGDTPNEQNQLADTAFLRNSFLGGSNSLVTWMSAITGGQLTFVPAGDGLYTTEPSAELRDADKNGCHTNLATQTAENHLKSLGVTWDSLAIVFDIAACGWGGLGQVPGKLTWYPPRPSLAAIVHELGHNQGYPHQSKHDCASGNMSSCNANGHSGNTPMGGGGSGRGYSSVELMHSGWISAGSKVSASSPGTFNLTPLYTGSGTRVVEYKASSSLSYVIETRAPNGAVDSAINNPGVRIYAVTNGSYRNAPMINPGAGYFPAGATLTDTANKLKITVRSSSASGATVQVASLTAPVSKSPSASASASASPSPSVSPSAEVSSDPVPDKESDLLDATASPTIHRGPPLWLVLSATGVMMAMIIAGFSTYAYRTRRRPRHRW